MVLIQDILLFLLISGLISGLVGVWFYNNYLKKISCLSAAYTSLILILVIFSKNSDKASQLFTIITTIIILFSITLAVGICIIFNISKLENNETK